MTSNKKIQDSIKSVMSDIFNEKLPEDNKDISKKLIKKWDSINHLKIILSLEKEFGVKFNDQEAFELTNFEKLYESLTKYKIK